MNTWETQQVFAIMKVHCQAAIVACIYVTIQHHRLLSFEIFCVPPGAAFALSIIEGATTSSMAELYEEAWQIKMKLRSTLVHNPKQKYMKRVILAYRPTRCQNVFFQYKRNTKLLTLELLLSLVNYTLVTF